MPAAPDEAFCRSTATVAQRGHALATTFMDHARPARASPLNIFRARLPMVTGLTSSQLDDVQFLAEALRGLVGVAGNQVQGVGALFAAGPPIALHPLSTLVRGVAEAVGKIWWQVAPWIDDSRQAPEMSSDEWDAVCRPVLARARLARLDALADRRRRMEAAHGGGSPQHLEADAALLAYKDRLKEVYPANFGLVLTGGRRKWRVADEVLPEATELATAATEYAYGQHMRGSGRNPYPLYSGYAHASLELIFAHADKQYRGPMSPLMNCYLNEAKMVAGLALRGLAAGLDIASTAFGTDSHDLATWEREVDALVIDRS